MDETAGEYHHGDQDASAQVASYHAFNTLTKWGALHLGVLITMLTLWFCVGTGFWGGLIPGLILLAAGIAFLRRKHPQEV